MPEVVDQLKHAGTGETLTCRFQYQFGAVTEWSGQVRLAQDNWHHMRGGTITGLTQGTVVPAVREAVQDEWDTTDLSALLKG